MQPKPQRVEKKHSSKGTVNHFSICDIHQSAVIIHSYLLPLIRSSFPQISRDENYHVLFPGSWETASQNRRYGIRGQNETTADNPLVPSRQRSPKNAVPHQRQQKVRTASYSLSTKHLHLPYIYIPNSNCFRQPQIQQHITSFFPHQTWTMARRAAADIRTLSGGFSNLSTGTKKPRKKCKKMDSTLLRKYCNLRRFLDIPDRARFCKLIKSIYGWRTEKGK